MKRRTCGLFLFAVIGLLASIAVASTPTVAVYFDEVVAQASKTNARDVAVLLDSPGDDHLHAVGNLAELTTPSVVIRAYDFRRVTAVSSQGGHDTKHVETIDYVLRTIGPWIDV